MVNMNATLTEMMKSLLFGVVRLGVFMCLLRIPLLKMSQHIFTLLFGNLIVF